MKIPELTWPSDQESYDDDLLIEMRAGTVTLLIRGRNAWQSTWVRHYLRNATLYTDTGSAKVGAEPQRGPGNVFYIIDAPAILLSGQRSHVVLCDAHPDNPFGAFTGFTNFVTESTHGTWIDGLFPGISVQDAVATFRHNSGHWSGATPSEHSLRSGRLDSADEFQTGSRSMQSLVSRPVGSNYYLRWNPHSKGNRYTRRGANALTKRWAAQLSEAMGDKATGLVTADLLRRHREEVLVALPKSQWLAKKARDQTEKSARRQEAFRRWNEASDRAAELENALWDAAAERHAAQEARMKPAPTSVGLRAQRERYEVAVSEEDRLTKAHARAEEEADELWNSYTRS